MLSSRVLFSPPHLYICCQLLKLDFKRLMSIQTGSGPLALIKIYILLRTCQAEIFIIVVIKISLCCRFFILKYSVRKKCFKRIPLHHKKPFLLREKQAVSTHSLKSQRKADTHPTTSVAILPTVPTLLSLNLRLSCPLSFLLLVAASSLNCFFLYPLFTLYFSPFPLFLSFQLLLPHSSSTCVFIYPSFSFF